MALKRLEIYQTELQTLVNTNQLFTMGLKMVGDGLKRRRKEDIVGFLVNPCSLDQFFLPFAFQSEA